MRTNPFHINARGVRLGLLGLCVLGAVAMDGCAKFPSSGALNNSARLTFNMSLAGKVRTGRGPTDNGLAYIYIIALNLNTDSNPTNPGPDPVVTPGGNGFVAGQCTHFILWNPLDSPQFKIWKFSDPTTLNNYSVVGTPVLFTPVNDGDKTMNFSVDMSQLVTDPSTIQSVQVNFLTMNTQNPSAAPSARLWDALGNGNITSQINAPVLVQLNGSRTYNNANTGGFEVTGDVPDPDLDISDWSVTVTQP